MSPGAESETARAVVNSLLIDAPRDRVFRAFSEPAHLARWWGPDGFSSTFEVFEPRTGGTWKFAMHGPDGKNYPNESRFVEIVPPARVVIEHLGEYHHFFLTISFEARGEKTLVGWRQVFDTVEHRDEVAAFVTKANDQNLNRLASEVRNVR